LDLLRAVHRPRIDQFVLAAAAVTPPAQHEIVIPVGAALDFLSRRA
jgi:hypothetical protein